MRIIIAACAVALSLIGCADAQPYRGGYGGYGSGGPVPPVRPAPNEPLPPQPGARTFAYVCDDLTKITIVEGQGGTATATLNSGLALSLSRRGPGHYGVPPYEFRIFDSADAQWFNNGKVWRCRFGS